MKIVLVVLDGWGISRNKKGNAIFEAKPENFNYLLSNYPSTTLNASGEHVGLLPGFIGNSEVGHLHIGAGRLVKQDLVRILDDIESGEFFKNKVLARAMKDTLHLIGLISDGGVHSHIKHLFALLDMAKKNGVKNVKIHAITDGRDVPPKSAMKYIGMIQKKLQALNEPNYRISTIIGRYYAMDRDNRWNRTKKAYLCLAVNEGLQGSSPEDAIMNAYKRHETDEFIVPTIINNPDMKNEDSVIFFNFRSDRARQLTQLFVDMKFRNLKIHPHFVCMTNYDEKINADVAYPQVHIANTLGEVISKKGLKQYRLAETEKYAHVTYFFNGLSSTIFKGEQRKLIPSPKVSTYDKRPQMSAGKVTKSAEKIISSKKYDFILINYANADMVGHTGVFSKCVRAVKFVDNCLGKIIACCKKNGYLLIVTADHGNAEQMLYPDGSICTAHTTNKVPFIILGHKLKKGNFSVYNIAPTVLNLMGVSKPKEMAESILQ